MADNTENSSLPLLLAISGAVLLVAVGGWYLQVPEPAPPTTPELAEDPAAEEEVADDPAPETTLETETIIARELDLDAELLKARLASSADVLVFPREQSALQYYGNIVEYDPQHAVAVAEMDAVLARVAQTVNLHLANNEFDQAYGIAAVVASFRPEHQLVLDTQDTLSASSESLVQQAIALAQGGDDDAAISMLAAAEALPGQNASYFTGIRNSIVEIQQVRQAAEDDRVQRSLLESEQAKEAWIASTRTAIAVGNLITPEGASAADLLAEDNEWEAERNTLTAELRQALIATAQTHIDSTSPAPAEVLLEAATIINAEADADELEAMRNTLEASLVGIESARVVRVADLVAIRKNPPKYPNRAEELGITGSVNVEFTLNIDGSTSDVVVVASEPTAMFDLSAVTAVRNWQFEPKEYRGQLINQRVSARLVFQLN